MHVEFDPDVYGPWTLESHQNSLASISRSKGGDRTLRLMCLPIGMLVLELQLAGNKKHLDTIESDFKSINALSLLGREVPSGEVTLERTHGFVTFSVRLENEGLKSLQNLNNDQDGLYVSGSSPRYTWSLINETFHTRNLTDNLAFVQKLCL